MNLEECQLEILRQYKYALIHIGVDLSREDVQEALLDCFNGLEEALMAVISYWKWKEKLDYPSAVLIKALSEQWKPYNWNPAWMNDPNFISPASQWWNEAERWLGRDNRNFLIADVVDNDKGDDYILFRNGSTLTLTAANKIGWERVLELAQQRQDNRNYA